eukprot:gene21690-27735_t
MQSQDEDIEDMGFDLNKMEVEDETENGHAADGKLIGSTKVLQDEKEQSKDSKDLQANEQGNNNKDSSGASPTEDTVDMSAPPTSDTMGGISTSASDIEFKANLTKIEPVEESEVIWDVKAEKKVITRIQNELLVTVTKDQQNHMLKTALQLAINDQEEDNPIRKDKLRKELIAIMEQEQADKVVQFVKGMLSMTEAYGHELNASENAKNKKAKKPFKLKDTEIKMFCDSAKKDRAAEKERQDLQAQKQARKEQQDKRLDELCLDPCEDIFEALVRQEDWKDQQLQAYFDRNTSNDHDQGTETPVNSGAESEQEDVREIAQGYGRQALYAGDAPDTPVEGSELYEREAQQLQKLNESMNGLKQAFVDANAQSPPKEMTIDAFLERERLKAERRERKKNKRRKNNNDNNESDNQQSEDDKIANNTNENDNEGQNDTEATNNIQNDKNIENDNTDQTDTRKRVTKKTIAKAQAAERERTRAKAINKQISNESVEIKIEQITKQEALEKEKRRLRAENKTTNLAAPITVDLSDIVNNKISIAPQASGRTLSEIRLQIYKEEWDEMTEEQRERLIKEDVRHQAEIDKHGYVKSWSYDIRFLANKGDKERMYTHTDAKVMRWDQAYGMLVREEYARELMIRDDTWIKTEEKIRDRVLANKLIPENIKSLFRQDDVTVMQIIMTLRKDRSLIQEFGEIYTEEFSKIGKTNKDGLDACKATQRRLRKLLESAYKVLVDQWEKRGTIIRMQVKATNEAELRLVNFTDPHHINDQHRLMYESRFSREDADILREEEAEIQAKVDAQNTAEYLRDKKTRADGKMSARTLRLRAYARDRKSRRLQKLRFWRRYNRVHHHIASPINQKTGSFTITELATRDMVQFEDINDINTVNDTEMKSMMSTASLIRKFKMSSIIRQVVKPQDIPITQHAHEEDDRQMTDTNAAFMTIEKNDIDAEIEEDLVSEEESGASECESEDDLDIRTKHVHDALKKTLAGGEREYKRRNKTEKGEKYTKSLDHANVMTVVEVKRKTKKMMINVEKENAKLNTTTTTTTLKKNGPVEQYDPKYNEKRAIQKKERQRIADEQYRARIAENERRKQAEEQKYAEEEMQKYEYYKANDSDTSRRSNNKRSLEEQEKLDKGRVISRQDSGSDAGRGRTTQVEREEDARSDTTEDREMRQLEEAQRLENLAALSRNYQDFAVNSRPLEHKQQNKITFATAIKTTAIKTRRTNYRCSTPNSENYRAHIAHNKGHTSDTKTKPFPPLGTPSIADEDSDEERKKRKFKSNDREPEYHKSNYKDDSDDEDDDQGPPGPTETRIYKPLSAGRTHVYTGKGSAAFEKNSKRQRGSANDKLGDSTDSEDEKKSSESNKSKSSRDKPSKNFKYAARKLEAKLSDTDDQEDNKSTTSQRTDTTSTDDLMDPESDKLKSREHEIYTRKIYMALKKVARDEQKDWKKKIAHYEALRLKDKVFEEMTENERRDWFEEHGTPRRPAELLVTEEYFKQFEFTKKERRVLRKSNKARIKYYKVVKKYPSRWIASEIDREDMRHGFYEGHKINSQRPEHKFGENEYITDPRVIDGAVGLGGESELEKQKRLELWTRKKKLALDDKMKYVVQDYEYEADKFEDLKKKFSFHTMSEYYQYTEVHLWDREAQRLHHELYAPRNFNEFSGTTPLVQLEEQDLIAGCYWFTEEDCVRIRLENKTELEREYARDRMELEKEMEERRQRRILIEKAKNFRYPFDILKSQRFAALAEEEETEEFLHDGVLDELGHRNSNNTVVPNYQNNADWEGTKTQMRDPGSRPKDMNKTVELSGIQCQTSRQKAGHTREADYQSVARRRLIAPFCNYHKVGEADPALVFSDTNDVSAQNHPEGLDFNTAHVIYRNTKENEYMYGNGVRIPERIFWKMTDICDYLMNSRRFIFNPSKVDPLNESHNKMTKYFNGVFIYMAGVGKDNKYRTIAFQEDMEKDIYGRVRHAGDLTESTTETWNTDSYESSPWLRYVTHDKVPDPSKIKMTKFLRSKDRTLRLAINNERSDNKEKSKKQTDISSFASNNGYDWYREAANNSREDTGVSTDDDTGVGTSANNSGVDSENENSGPEHSNGDDGSDDSSSSSSDSDKDTKPDKKKPKKSKKKKRSSDSDSEDSDSDTDSNKSSSSNSTSNTSSSSSGSDSDSYSDNEEFGTQQRDDRQDPKTAYTKIDSEKRLNPMAPAFSIVLHNEKDSEEKAIWALDDMIPRLFNMFRGGDIKEDDVNKEIRKIEMSTTKLIGIKQVMDALRIQYNRLPINERNSFRSFKRDFEEAIAPSSEDD